MKILLVGATGTIGSAVATALRDAGDEVAMVGRSSGDRTVDMADKKSIEALFEAVGRVDAVVCTAGIAKFGPLQELSDEDYALSMRHKLMGQVNLVRVGVEHVAPGGSFTLTTGTLSQEPTKGTAAVAMVGGALESFVKAAALDLGEGARINAVSPAAVKESMEAMGRAAPDATPAAVVAQAYVRAVHGQMTGRTIYVEGA